MIATLKMFRPLTLTLCCSKVYTTESFVFKHKNSKIFLYRLSEIIIFNTLIQNNNNVNSYVKELNQNSPELPLYNVRPRSVLRCKVRKSVYMWVFIHEFTPPLILLYCCKAQHNAGILSTKEALSSKIHLSFFKYLSRVKIKLARVIVWQVMTDVPTSEK